MLDAINSVNVMIDLSHILRFDKSDVINKSKLLDWMNCFSIRLQLKHRL